LGDNQGAQLGVGGYGWQTNRRIPSRVGTDSNWSAVTAGMDHTIGLKSTGSAQPPGGTLWAWGLDNNGALGLGDNNSDIPSQVGTDSDWLLASAGGSYTIALRTNMTLWSCGRNNVGQLGLGDTNNRKTLTQIGTDSDWLSIKTGFNHTLGLKPNGVIWVWGGNDYGQLGLVDTVQRNIPHQLGSPAIPLSLIATTVSCAQINLSWTR